MMSDAELLALIGRLQVDGFATEEKGDAAAEKLCNELPEAYTLLFFPLDEVARSAAEVLAEARHRHRIFIAGQNGVRNSYPARKKR